MAIVTARAVSYELMESFLRDEDPTGACAALAARHDRVWVISVTNSPDCPSNCFEGWEAGPVPLVEDGEDKIALVFDDVEPRRDGASGDELGRDARYAYFDTAMAQKACAFIHRAHHDDPARRDLLLVNCHAGVSRSGALVDFARTVLGIDYDAFKRANPQIVPNVFVLRTLFDAWTQLGFPLPAR